MKIAMISPYSVRKVTGVGTSIIDTCREFNAKNIDYTLVVPAVSDPLELDKIFTRGENFFEISSPRMTYLQNLGIISRILRLLLRSRKNIDVVHIFSINSITTAVAVLARILDKPIVTTIYIIPPLPEPTLKRYIQIISASFIFRLTDRFAYETDVARRQCGNRPGVIIPEGVDVDYFRYNKAVRARMRKKLSIADDEFALLYSGRLVESKGIIELITAVKALPKDVSSKLKLILIGNVESEGVKKELRSVSNKPWYIYHEPVGRDEIKNFYCCADSFVLPSYYEGVSSSLIEAMSAGLPTIVTRAGGNVEVITNNRNGLMVEPRNPAGLKDAIVKMFRKKSLRKRLSKTARRTVVKSFSLANKSRLIVKLYKEVIKLNKMEKQY
jgi:glycosyltransferase involved in cell wall biosynthesis